VKARWRLGYPIAGENYAGEGAMELAFVIVVVVIAGAMIPGNPQIRYFH
jgi:hypothetical protein